MKLILAMVLVGGSAYAEDLVIIPPDVVKACNDAGGCVLVPEKLLQQQLEKAFAAGVAQEAARQKVCLKSQT